ncbi:MAG: hypothetical protein HYZ15_10395 [Sphingobacteriales bacterium]|nr:hypothetical protein [Sphingobacteriales bacterium]
MKKIILIAFILAMHRSEAQQKSPYWTAGFNPLGPVESLSSLGPCVGYRISPAFGFWTEGTYIFHNLYKIAGWEKVRGYRFLFQPRFYSGGKSHSGRRKKVARSLFQPRFYSGGEQRIFLTPELRIKNFSYQAVLPFINKATGDTLQQYRHRASQFQLGGALVLGVQTRLPGRRNFFLELTAGIGGKLRYIKRKNIPAGYAVELQQRGFGLAPHYEWDNDSTPYVPLGLRLTWELARRHQ